MWISFWTFSWTCAWPWLTVSAMHRFFFWFWFTHHLRHVWHIYMSKLLFWPVTEACDLWPLSICYSFFFNHYYSLFRPVPEACDLWPLSVCCSFVSPRWEHVSPSWEHVSTRCKHVSPRWEHEGHSRCSFVSDDFAIVFQACFFFLILCLLCLRARDPGLSMFEHV